MAGPLYGPQWSNAAYVRSEPYFGRAGARLEGQSLARLGNALLLGHLSYVEPVSAGFRCPHSHMGGHAASGPLQSKVMCLLEFPARSHLKAKAPRAPVAEFKRADPRLLPSPGTGDRSGAA